MRKFTTLATVLLLGGIGITANADQTSIQPTITPAENTTVFTLDNPITVSWGDNEITYNTEADNYVPEEDWGDGYGSPAFLQVSLLKDGEEWTSYGYPVLTNAKIGEDGTSLVIEGPYTPNESCEITFVLPAESVFIGQNEDTNAKLEITYNYVFLPSDVTPDPAKGSVLFNINSFSLQWGEEANEEWGTPNTITEIASVNSDNTAPITYIIQNENTYEQVASGEITNVTVANGQAELSFAETIATGGQLTVSFPEGYFMLKVGNENYPSPEAGFSYYIHPVAIYPATSSWQRVAGPFGSFSLYAEKSISLVGSLNDFVITDGDGNSYSVASYSETEVNDYQALEFVLDKPCFSNELNINVKSGTLNVDGEVYNYDASWLYYIFSPTVTPAYGETIDQLDKVTLSWDGAELEILENSGLTPTLSFNGGTAQNISENISVVTVDQEIYDPMMGDSYTIPIPTLAIDFSEAPYTEAGTYTITIPANYVLLNYDDYNNEITLVYTVEGTTDDETPSGLGNAKVTSGLFGGKYLVAADGVQNVEAEYVVDGEAVELQFVDEDAEYVTANLTVPGSTTALKVQVGLVDNGSYGVMADEDDAEPVSGNALVFMLNDLDYTWVAGSYTLSLPANVVTTADGETNGAQRFNFTVLTEYVTNPTFSPAPLGDDSNGYYSQNELSAVTLTYPGKLTLVEGDITYGDNQVLAGSNVKVNNNSLVLNLSSLAPGTYNFQIPSGYALVGSDAMVGNTYFTYTVWNGLKPAEMIMGPAPVAQYVTNIELSYGEDIEFAMATVPALNVYADSYDTAQKPALTIPAANVSIQTVLVGEGGEPATDGDSTGETEELSVLYLDIEELFAGKTGTYVIVIPEGLVKNESSAINPAQEIIFTLQAVYEGEAEVEVSDAGVVTVTWAGVDNVGFNAQIQPYLQTPAGSKEVLTLSDQFNDGEIEPTDDNDGAVIDLTSYLTVDGNYLLVLPEGYFNIEVDDEAYINSELVVELTVENGVVSETEDGETSAVESILNDAVVKGVYNLKGMKVSDDLNTLAPGLYIINGKKVLVK